MIHATSKSVLAALLALASAADSSVGLAFQPGLLNSSETSFLRNLLEEKAILEEGMSRIQLFEGKEVPWLVDRLASFASADVSHVHEITLMKYEDTFKAIPHWHAEQTTVVLYLSSLNGTGCGQTVFPDLNLAVTPVDGSAIAFNNYFADGTPDYRTSHSTTGSVASRNGDKYILTASFGAPLAAAEHHTELHDKNVTVTTSHARLLKRDRKLVHNHGALRARNITVTTSHARLLKHDRKLASNSPPVTRRLAEPVPVNNLRKLKRNLGTVLRK